MKVEELMIGDLVSVEGEVLRVGGLSNYDIYVDLFRDNENEVYSQIWADELDAIEPIPLTPEILEKNGFENDFYETESVADYVAIQIEGYSLRCKSRGCDFDSALVKWCNGRCDIVTDDDYEMRGAMIYVHQLQHALRLCGIEKEIEV